jgi:UDP-glucose 4-epimerase
MKRILITGANSYIGTSLENYINENYADLYSVDTIDLIDESWREKDFTGYDVVFHVAGLAHIRETKNNSELYYKINRDLAFETAWKSKQDGVKQFIYLSSLSVYGMDTGIITAETKPKPKSSYGKSKLEAERLIEDLNNEHFRVVNIRPPMVYGKGCKGNFNRIVSLVKKFPVFPKVTNQRSMIYITNLCAFIEMVIRNNAEGLFIPQNEVYMNTSQMVEWIAEKLEKKLYCSYLLGFFVLVCRPFLSVLRKSFGTLTVLTFDESISSYCIVNLETSVKDSV